MPMTTAQRKHLERRLLEERDRVTRSLARYAAATRDTVQEETGELSTFRSHLADLGSDTADRELDASNAARQTHELAEIDAALERLYHHPDEFGVCERAGEPIPFDRLDVLPWARTCLAHAA